MTHTDSFPLISFIGGGNMAESLIGGLVSSGCGPDNIRASDPVDKQRRRLEKHFRVQTYGDNSECVGNADIVVLAVKPQRMKQAIASIDGFLAAEKPLVISIAAGIRIQQIVQWIGADLPVIRVMPNTPALINCGVSGLLANSKTTREHRNSAEFIMNSVGAAVWVESEHDIDVVTGISGSGPAYYFKLMEIMMNCAAQHGLSEDNAKTLVLKTALGAAKLACHSEHLPAELRRRVTSPGGTTQAALDSMERNGIDGIVSQAIEAAIDRSDELAGSLGES